jgi:dynactin complex subunit
MVNFENLKVGSRVQTTKDGEVFLGTVRYKGGLITREGNWVGVELDKPGTTNDKHGNDPHSESFIISQSSCKFDGGSICSFVILDR